jgi:hypothetical protein
VEKIHANGYPPAIRLRFKVPAPEHIDRLRIILFHFAAFADQHQRRRAVLSISTVSSARRSSGLCGAFHSTLKKARSTPHPDRYQPSYSPRIQGSDGFMTIQFLLAGKIAAAFAVSSPFALSPRISP